MRDRIEIGRRTNDYVLIPTIGILDMDAEYYSRMTSNRYAYRLSFAFWNFRMSIGLGKARW